MFDFLLVPLSAQEMAGQGAQPPLAGSAAQAGWWLLTGDKERSEKMREESNSLKDTSVDGSILALAELFFLRYPSVQTVITASKICPELSPFKCLQNLGI